MKFSYIISLIFCYNSIVSQNDSVTTWINKNCLSLENFNPEEKADYFIKYTDIFNKVEIFGVGESTHQHKEFFDTKIQLFKYLVLKHNVKKFILEESYGAAYELNEYLNGKDGDLRQLESNLKQKIWQTEEMHNLFLWVKKYNQENKGEDKITFYGMDTMFNYNISNIIKSKLEKSNIIIPQEINDILEHFNVEKNIPDYDKLKKNDNLKKTDHLRKYILSGRIENQTKSDLLNAITILEQNIHYIFNPNQNDRDKFMAENVSYIIKNNPQSKTFIWSHNEHIKKTKLIRSNIETMGNWLNKEFKEKYYSIGLNFGVGEISGMDKNGKWKIFQLNEPYKYSSSSIFFNADKNIYFFDFNEANNNKNMNSFLSKTSNHICIGGYGLLENQIKYALTIEKLNEMYNAMIFIKKVSLVEQTKF